MHWEYSLGSMPRREVLHARGDVHRPAKDYAQVMEANRRRRPLVGLVVVSAVIQLVGTRFAAARQPEAHMLDWLAIALLLAGPALLLLHRRAPEVMLGGAVAVTAAYFWLGYPWGPAPLTLALALVLATAARRRVFSWSVAGALIAALLVWAAANGGALDMARATAVSGWLGILVLFGEAVRLRLDRIAERRAKAKEAAARAEDEYRLNLARDIHDVVAHSLSMINVRASVALHLAERDPAQLRPALEAIKSASKDSLDQVRELLGVLRRDAPLQPGLSLAGLPQLLEDAKGSGLVSELTYDADPRLLRERLGPAGETVVYRVVQEAATNAIRHAEAARLEVRLAVETGPGVGQTLVVSVQDDGHGPQGAPEGNGLRGMRERVATLGGALEFVELYPGSCVKARIPLAPAMDLPPGPKAGETT